MNEVRRVGEGVDPVSSVDVTKGLLGEEEEAGKGADILSLRIDFLSSVFALKWGVVLGGAVKVSCWRMERLRVD